jgi:hypothetical protein
MPVFSKQLIAAVLMFSGVSVASAVGAQTTEPVKAKNVLLVHGA